jgi:AcrR family transcriptional regulator
MIVMPKRIENLQESILQQAKGLLLERGYEALTMREVAAGCGIAVGTLYNYFPSKEALAGGVMLEDWHAVLARVKAGCAAAPGLTQGLTALYEGVMRFSARYEGIWEGYGFVGGHGLDFTRRHRLLVRQLADCLAPLMEKLAAPPQADVFLVENIMICTGRSDMTFASFLAIAQRLWASVPDGAGENTKVAGSADAAELYE